jgi:hypothetical protein
MANPSGGTGSYTYQWYSGISAAACSALGSPISGATSATYSPSPSSTTYYCYTVTDSASAPETHTSVSTSLTVNPALTAPATPTASATALDANQVLTVTGTIPSTGTPAYAWQWLVSVNGAPYAPATQCSVNSGTGASGGAAEACSIPATTLAVGKTYAFELQVTDGAVVPETRLSAASSTIDVCSALTAPMVPTESATSLNIDQPLNITGTIPTTGTPTYSWQWLVSINGGTYASATQCAVNRGTGAVGGATKTCSIAANTLTVGDTYAFELEVADSATSPSTQLSSATTPVTVTSPSSPSSSSSNWTYVGILVGVLVAAVLVALAVVLRRRRPRAGAVPSTQVEPAGPAFPASGGPVPATPVYLEAAKDVGQAPLDVIPSATVGARAATLEAPVGAGAESDFAELLAELDKLSGEVRKKSPKETTNDEQGAESAKEGDKP